jgi:hypothetical protein
MSEDRKQVILTTETDIHGRRFTKECLEQMANVEPESKHILWNWRHASSKSKPVGKVKSFEVVQREDGESEALIHYTLNEDIIEILEYFEAEFQLDALIEGPDKNDRYKIKYVSIGPKPVKPRKTQGL